MIMTQNISLTDALQQFHDLNPESLITFLAVIGPFFAFSSFSLLTSTILEQIYLFIRSEIKNTLSGYVRKYFFFIFFLAWLIFSFNIFGMAIYSYSPSSQILITMLLSLIINYMTTHLAIYFQKWFFLNTLLPAGSPRGIAFLLVFIEMIAFLSRIVSIAVRLFANITAGHILLKVLSTFSIIFLFSFNIYFFLIVIPNLIVLILTVLETAIAILQTYVFITLTILYFSNALSAH